MGIEFRGKRTDTDAWIHGILYNGKTWTAIHDESVCDCWDDFKEVKPETIGQFSGLHDLSREGQRIYAADIMEWTANDGSGTKRRGVVRFMDGAFMVVNSEGTPLYLPAVLRMDGVVIGNEFDDGGLL